MKPLATLFLAVLVLCACNRHPAPSPLTGTWLLNDTNVNGSVFQSRLVIDSTGGYTAVINVPTSTNSSIRTATLSGYMQLTNGTLVDTMTRHSNTNANLPWISRGRVVRLDDKELILKWEETDRGVMPTNETIFRKID